jgi:uncharacterized protein YndB with AHSA1/START domain
MSTATAEKNDTLKITRRIKAPRERVFAAFTSAESIRQWFGPGPVKVQECSVDFRVGGKYHIKALTPDGESVVSGVYREITPPSTVAYTWKWEDDEDWVNVESLVTFEFKAVGDETELVLTHTGFPSDESRGRHTHGWGGCLDKLDNVLTGAPLPNFEHSC